MQGFAESADNQQQFGALCDLVCKVWRLCDDCVILFANYFHYFQHCVILFACCIVYLQYSFSTLFNP